MWSLLFFLWVLMHTKLCVCPPRVKFLFPLVLWGKSCSQIPLAMKAGFSRNSSCCQSPRLGGPVWGLEPSLQWENFCSRIIFQFVGIPPGRYGIWFCHDCALPTVWLWFFLCLSCRVSFLVGFSVFVSMVVQQLVVILVLSQEGVSPCPSAPPFWVNLPKIYLCFLF